MACGVDWARATLLGPVTNAAAMAPPAAARMICRRVSSLRRSTSSESRPVAGAISILLCARAVLAGPPAPILRRLTELDAAKFRQVRHLRGQDHRDDDQGDGKRAGGGRGRLELIAQRDVHRV